MDKCKKVVGLMKEAREALPGAAAEDLVVLREYRQKVDAVELTDPEAIARRAKWGGVADMFEAIAEEIGKDGVTADERKELIAALAELRSDGLFEGKKPLGNYCDEAKAGEASEDPAAGTWFYSPEKTLPTVGDKPDDKFDAVGRTRTGIRLNGGQLSLLPEGKVYKTMGLTGVLGTWSTDGDKILLTLDYQYGERAETCTLKDNELHCPGKSAHDVPRTEVFVRR